MFFNEEDLLTVRLEEHSAFIDKFVIIELNETHSGLRKEQNFKPEKYEKFKGKIFYKFLDAGLIPSYKALIPYEHSGNINSNKSHWERENFQRNFSKIILKSLGVGDSDTVLSSDLDEIIDEKTFETCKQKIKTELCPRSNLKIAKVKQRHRNYKVNLLSDTFGYGPRVMEFATYDKIDPSLLREYNLGFVACEGGWHFSYLSKDKGGILTKMKSFSHAYQQDDVSTEDEAFKKMFKMVSYSEPIGDGYPKEILRNLDHYKEYIWHE